MACLLLSTATVSAQQKSKSPSANVKQERSSTFLELDEDDDHGEDTAPALGLPSRTQTTPSPLPAPTLANDYGTDLPSDGICALDPEACQQQARNTVIDQSTRGETLYAVEQIYALKTYRLALEPYWSFSLNDQYISHPGPGLSLNYYLTNWLALGVNGNWYQGFNVDSAFNFQNRRATRTAVPLNEYRWGANFNTTFVPMSGKFAGFSKFIFQYDVYLVAGVGLLATRPMPVIDPDNRSFSFTNKLGGGAGIGLRIFVSEWLAATLEVRDFLYQEQLEALTVEKTQTGQQDKDTWFGDKVWTHHVQAQLGVSMFFPFHREYRLPK